MSKVRITIRPNGQRQVEVEGVPGADCRVASRPYQEALGGQVVSDNPTYEMDLPSAHQGQSDQEYA